MRRTEARELCMKLIFQMEAQKDFSNDAAVKFADEQLGEDEQRAYFDNVINAFLGNKTEIDNKIEAAAKGWHLGRLAKVDLAVLRLCICEFVFVKDPEVSTATSINEAVNIAKKYGGDDSGKYVNGVLGTISRSL